MTKTKKQSPKRKPVMLDESTHRDLKIESAKTGLTIGQLIARLWRGRKGASKEVKVSNE